VWLCGSGQGTQGLKRPGSDPKHEEYDELAEWAPPGFDAEAFDVEEATEMMRSSRPLLDW